MQTSGSHGTECTHSRLGRVGGGASPVRHTLDVGACAACCAVRLHVAAAHWLVLGVL